MAITLDGATGVTAAEFDGTVDASNLTGTLPAIDGSALTGIDTTPSTSDVLTATAGASAGAVGTYAYLVTASNTVDPVAGSTYAGSGLRYAAVTPMTLTNSYNNNYHWPATGATVSGTWRAVGTSAGHYSGFYVATLFLRIS